MAFWCGHSVFTRAVWGVRCDGCLGLLGEVRMGGPLPLVDVVIPVCGVTRCTSRYVRSLVGRACGGVRVVLMSSNSASRSPIVYSRFTRRSRQVGIVRGEGKKLDSTHGTKLSITAKRCVNFISNSS